MLAKRIIPCLDVKEGMVVKGTKFEDLKTMGDPVKMALEYELQGADELIFLDISASHEKRKTIIELVKNVAKEISIPFTVGGGIQTIDDIQLILCAGADKISINSAAVRNPELITKAAEMFGSQCIVIAIDAKRTNNQEKNPSLEFEQPAKEKWLIYLEGGKIPTNIEAIDWGRRVKELGAGELLPTSIDNDGVNQGYDLELNRKLSEETKLPLIASGGAGELRHIYEVLTIGKADAALAASIFHKKEYSIKEVKSYLKERGIAVRIT